MPSLARTLADYDPDLLQIIASLWDFDLPTDDRHEAARWLAGVMATQEAVDATWEHLSPEVRETLAELQSAGGKLPYARFIRRYGELRPMGPARREREKPWLNPVSISEALYYRGLIVRAFERGPDDVREFILIPDELLGFLPHPVAEGSRPPGYAVAPPRRIEKGMATAPDDMATLLSYLMLREVDARPWLSAIPDPVIDRHLRRPDTPAYRALLVHLAYDLDLIYNETFLTQTQTKVNREAARTWLEAPRDLQTRSLAEAWLNSPAWNELVFIPGIEADNWPNNARNARLAIMAALRGVPTEIWWSTESLVEYVKEALPDFLRPNGDYAAWYLRDVSSGEILHGFQYWDLIDGEVVRLIVEGPMSWLGLVMCGGGAFSFTPCGLALVGKGPWPSSPDAASRIHIDAQGIVTVPAALSRYERVQLSRFTAWLEAPPPADFIPHQPGSDSGAYRYRLTPQAIARVTNDKITIDGHITPFLQRLSGRQVPGNVLKMLEAWHNYPNEVVIHDVVVLQARDISVAERLKRNKRVGQWLGEQIRPNVYIVQREHMAALFNALREMGILPLFEGYAKDDLP